ncbi:MAG TPA: hypothetical protein DC001_02735 [Clostridiales bacterium]|jgi:crotonobetainyl-CoA:carnitine CoA-transferase CaiB-like acyl-CoA transferase|nr:hypothetical protein [Clostridiales bacterium]HBR08462.1 hypothetical protein [Clostridiales bacterium]
MQKRKSAIQKVWGVILLNENVYVEKVEFADGLKAILPNPPIAFSEYGRKPYVPTGKIGENTDEIFASVGYTQEQIDAMRQNGAII